MIVRRLRCRGRSVHIFDQERKAFNDEMMALCPSHPDISFSKSRLFDNKILQWSKDRIHPTTEYGRKRYIGDLKNEIQFIVKKLRWRNKHVD